jgi:hypothetical protein
VSAYVGFFRPNLEYRADTVARARRGEAADPEVVRLISELPGSLPEGCRILGAFTTVSASHPGVLIVEAVDTASLDFISRYYRGYLEYDWVPCRVLGATEGERARFLQGRASSGP